MRPPEVCDLVVIGAGVNGAAAARDGAMRGLRVVLVDAEDLCAGTSAWSSRMIHGGLRYLEHYEFRLVRESLRERERLLHMAAHLVAPYPLLIPFYRHNSRSGWLLRMGMIAYDVLSFDKTTPRHRILSTRTVAERYPGIGQEGLTGAAVYYDAQVLNAERLAVEQALDIAAAGGTVLTHWRVTGITPADGGPVTVALTDELTGERAMIAAGAVVDAAGPWVDRVLSLTGRQTPRYIGGSKGSHITVRAFPGAPATGVHYEARKDGRAVLVLPIEEGRVLIGSTDLFFDDEPGRANCTDAEVEYLLDEVNHLIPGAGLTPDDVLHSYAGVRPLPYTPKAKSEAAVSRDHHVLAVPGAPGVFAVTGGKLTTHGALGRLAVDKVGEYLKGRPGGSGRSLPPSTAQQSPLPGIRTADWASFQRDLRARAGLAAPVADRLLKVYGTRAQLVLDTAAGDPVLAEVIPGTGDVLAAEVAVALRHEFARTLTDVMARRLLLSRRDDVGLAVAPVIAATCAAVAGWEPGRADREVAAYRDWAAQTLRPRALAGTPATQTVPPPQEAAAPAATEEVPA